MVFDFSFILVVASIVTGVIWALDAWLWKPKRLQLIAQLEAQGGASDSVREPVVVEYARSFFPVIFIVLLIRSFLFEPFRIPSDSMMPTLLDGDFIFVNKFSYGLRLPVLNTKIVSMGEPKRGDVIVFRLPKDPSTNYIKRLVGLPGDHVVVKNGQIYVNGAPIPVKLDGPYTGPRATGLQADANIGIEQLGDATHEVLYIPDRYSRDFDDVIPASHYFFMGDNRDNSQDSRYPMVGLVPERNLVGKAVRIWFNWDLPEAPLWNRIGNAIK
jgi:signal peptidase I